MSDKEILMNVYTILGKEGFRRLAHILNDKCMRDIDIKHNDCKGNPIDIDTDYCIECTIQSIEDEFTRRSIKTQLSTNMLLMVNLIDFNPNVYIDKAKLNIQIEDYYNLMEEIDYMNEQELTQLRKQVRDDYEYLSALESGDGYEEIFKRY